MKEEKSKRNKTITLTCEEKEKYSKKLLKNYGTKTLSSYEITDKTIHGDSIIELQCIPDGFADLIIADPPYNLTKSYNGVKFKSTDRNSYRDYLRSWLPELSKKLCENGSLYLCCDWKCSSDMQEVLSEHLTIINRITWQREKGRGAKNNWKNGMEDIWFAVKNPKDYTFNLDAVKIKRKVIAPYRLDGKPKDWDETDCGNYRMTCPSNLWDDITIPFWSMPENTEHPTQKPEKLIAKLILASSNEGDMVFDPFLGSGTTSVTAKKLNRHYCGIEINEEYCCLAEKRLEMANDNKHIQGYENGVFYERNAQSN